MSLSQKRNCGTFLELAAAGEVDEAYGNYTAQTLSITILIMLVIRLL